MINLETFILPSNVTILSFEELDDKIANKETFVLYIGWEKCKECIFINERVLKNSKYKNIYYLESDKYRSNKPVNAPVLNENANDEELAQYEKDASNWTSWINFAKKYHFDNYRNGRIPTLQFINKGIVSDSIVYGNDEVMDDKIVNSFHKDLISLPIDIEKIYSFHDEKIREFLEKYAK